MGNTTSLNLESRLCAIQKDLDQINKLLENPLETAYSEIRACIPTLENHREKIPALQKHVSGLNPERAKNFQKDLQAISEKCERLYQRCLESKEQPSVSLPDEIWVEILEKNPDVQILTNISKVSKQLHCISKDQHLWKQCLERNFPYEPVMKSIPPQLQCQSHTLIDSNLTQGKYSAVDKEINKDNPFACVRNKTLITITKEAKGTKNSLQVFSWDKTPTDLTLKQSMVVDDPKKIAVQMSQTHTLFIQKKPLSKCDGFIYKDIATNTPQRIQKLEDQFMGYEMVCDELLFNRNAVPQHFHKKNKETGCFSSKPTSLKAFQILPPECVICHEDELIFGARGSISIVKKDSDNDDFHSKPFQVLYKVTPKELAVHHQTLFVLQPDGQMLAFAKDPATGQYAKKPLVVSQGNYTHFAPYKNFLLIGSENGSIEVWRRHAKNNSFQKVQTLKKHRAAITSIKMEDNCLMTTSLDGVLKIWKFGPGEGELLALSAREDQ